MGKQLPSLLLLAVAACCVGGSLAAILEIGVGFDQFAYSGNLVNFDEADNYCNYNFNNSKQYYALLKGNPNLGKFTGKNTFDNVNGDPVFIQVTIDDLFNGNLVPLNPILNPIGFFTQLTAWTGKNGQNCNNWTSISDSLVGDVGNPNSTVPGEWIFSGNASCYPGEGKHVLYCITNAGTIRGDPHFVGFDGCRFEFNGQDSSVFALYSDTSVQVNALFQAVPASIVDGNWMTKIGFRTKSATLVLDPPLGLFHAENGTVISATQTMNINDIKVGVVHEGNMVKSMILETTFMKLSAEVKRFSTDREEFFINIDMELYDRPVSPHGVIGQTARHLSASADASARHGCAPTEGGMEDYVVDDGIVGTSFKYSQYQFN